MRSRSPLGRLFLAARVVAGGTAALRIARARDVRPAVGAVVGGSSVSISVIVPARNEQQRIGGCLRALADDREVGEVIVVDDDSSDDTAALARSLGATVVTAGPLPDGWAGKCWALQQGLQAATGEWVVMLDADTSPAVGLVGAIVGRAGADGLRFLTLGGRFVCPTAALQALHPSMLTTLVYRFGPVGARRTSRVNRTIANGQCMVARRLDLLGVGGLAPVRSNLVEDVALARFLAARRWPVGFLDAGPLLTVAMHTDGGDAWRNWGRSLPLNEVTTPAWRAADVALVWLAQALPLARVVVGIGDALDIGLVAMRLGTLAGTRRAYVDPSPTYWLSILADIPVAARLTWGTLRPSRTWRGRTYRRS